MAKKVSAVMATQVALDTLSSVNSLKDLTSAVKVATGAWKSQETLLKSTGDYLKASEARYNGLGEAISRQKDKVEALKAKQSGLNVETKEGAQAYLKYQQDLDRATTQLNSMNAQQQKAKQSMDLQKTGIIGLNQEIRNGESVTKSFVERLKAEGRESDALKAKQTGLRDSLSKQQELYKKQESILGQVAAKSGKASDEYKQQQVRVNELGTKIAHTSNELKELNGQLSKKPHFNLSGITDKLSQINAKTERTGSLFRKVFGAQLLANGVINGLQSIKSHLTDTLKLGSDYVKYQDTMNAQWLTLTGNAPEGKKMVDMTNEMAQAAANSTEMVNDLNSKLYSTVNSADQTKVLTKSILTLQDAFGQTDDAVKNFATQYSQMHANGKVQAQDMMSFVNVFPKLRQELLTTVQQQTNNHELTMAQMNDLMSQGKINAETMDKVLESTAKKYQNATENFAKTIPGLERTINARMPAIIGAFETPLLKMKNPLLGAIGNWVSDKKTETEFNKLGDTFSKGISTITASFAEVFDVKDAGKGMDSMMDGLTNGVTKASESIAKHAPDIVSFFKATKEAGGTSFTIFVQTLKDLEPVLKIVGGYAKSNPKLFAEMAAGILIANKATQGLNLAFGSLASVFRLSSGVFNTIKFPFSQFKKMGVEGTKANKIIGGMKTTFSTMGSVFKSVGSGISAAAKFAFKSVADQAKLMGKGLAAVGKAGSKALEFIAKLGWSAVKSGSKLLGKSLVATGKAGMKALKFTAKISVKAAQLALKGLLKSAKLTGAGLKAAFNFAKANPLIAIAVAVAAVVAGLIALYGRL